MYWTDFNSYQVKRSDLDGSNIEVLIPRDTGLLSSAGLALDLFRGKMYWISGGTIRYADFDGSNLADFVTLASGVVQGVVLDPVAGHVFWSSWDFHPTFATRIQRADLVGSNIQDVITTGVPLGVAVDLCGHAGVVGLTDHVAFVGCLAGPGKVTIGDCYCIDLSSDARVDLIDYSILQRHFHEPKGLLDQHWHTNPP
jgi:hypothetical protein